MTGADAVIGALSPSLDRKATTMPLIEGTRNIVDAMQAAGVERYIGIATPSLRDARDQASLLGRVVPFMGRTFLRRAYRELLEMSQIVTHSPLNWTIARFTRPTAGASPRRTPIRPRPGDRRRPPREAALRRGRLERLA